MFIQNGKLETFVAKKEDVDCQRDESPEKEEPRRRLTMLEILKGLHFKDRKSAKKNIKY